MIFLLIYRIWNGASQITVFCFSLCLMWKLSSLWRMYVFAHLYVFYMCPCKGYPNNWKLLETSFSNLCVLRPHQPIGRKRNKSVFCLQVVVALNSPQLEGFFWFISWIFEDLLNHGFVHRYRWPSPDFLLKKSTILFKVLFAAVSQSWKILHQNRSIPLVTVV